MNDVDLLLDEARQTAWVVAGLAVLTALTLRDAKRAAKRARKHTASLEATALSCAACQPTGKTR